MNEKLLQLIWQYRYYDPNSLFTSGGEPVLVLNTGQYNVNQGPDFLDARIRVGETVWAGHVELHIRESDWHRHGHSGDPNYHNVVLHVVWECDREATLPFPTVELKGRVSKTVLERCAQLMNGSANLPCASHAGKVGSMTLLSWKERLLADRLTGKTALIREKLEKAGGHWGELFWQWLARSYGLFHNADCFERVAESLPVNRLRRLTDHALPVEALLFGQAALLENEFSDDYPKALQREYRYLAKMHRLKPPGPPPVFLRMRPVSFPTIRLSQLAAFLRNNRYPFGTIMDAENPADLKILFDQAASPYWDNHFVFDHTSASFPKKPGEAMLNAILINAVIPVLFAYGSINGLQAVREKAMDWLNDIPPERNSVAGRMKALGLECSCASDSQALMHLYRNYCLKRRCLECAIGIKLLAGKESIT